MHEISVGTLVQRFALSPYKLEGCGFACSPCGCVASLRLLQLPSTVQRRACSSRLFANPSMQHCDKLLTGPGYELTLGKIRMALQVWF